MPGILHGWAALGQVEAIRLESRILHVIELRLGEIVLILGEASRVGLGNLTPFGVEGRRTKLQPLERGGVTGMIKIFPQ